ncbi:hypothetical protein BJF80_16920 [Serinicoccus sp. CUA-874]|uniref:hypothetical protein n=1 Tax=Serinicoccus sp. CUA-874 TaxID=1517939 RepID=UPI000969B005|nr:hypothetical protein [Serinicoccus sp. CUA-874]OLT17498.1 hypothetical protein BJF80_16920 [Serinicoccus sp. CUA-874]OLT38218.1 hypothetical protein BJF82_13900 [Kytococcus sp. CUA-901]
MTPASRPDPPDVNRAIHDRIQGYRPQAKSIPADEWMEVADFTREAVRIAQPSTPGVATTELKVVAQFANWCRGQSLPLDPETILTPAWVNEYDRQKLRGSLARKDERARLRRIAVAATRKAPWGPVPDAVRRSPMLPPYSDVELALLATLADGQPTSRVRDAAAAILALGLGCGFRSREIIYSRAGDIEPGPDFVTVTTYGEAPRRVPVLPRYAPLLRKLSTRSPDARLVPGGDRLDNVMKKFRKVGGITIQPTRMRTTWLVDVLNAGVTVPELLVVSGMSTTHSLLRYAEFLDRRPDVDLYRALGGDP